MEHVLQDLVMGNADVKSLLYAKEKEIFTLRQKLSEKV